MTSANLDLNADLGESFGRWVLGDDEALLDVVTSANVACGFHAGDPAILVRTCRAAADRGVVIGAQVSYRDLAGFGRRFIEVNAEDLYADVLYQLAALDGIARTAGSGVAYLKPHGALYHASITHPVQAQAVVDAVADYDADLPILGFSGSLLLQQAADRGLRTLREGFADRAYQPDGTLVPRTEPGAVLHDPDLVAQRAVELAGSVDSLCLHGDSPGAVQMARAVRSALQAAGITMRAFAGPR